MGDVVNTKGVMLTWTTYGSWLRGDERGYVRGGEILEGDSVLKEMNRKSLVQRPVFFNKEGRLAVKEAIKAESQKWGQEILAIAVCKTHVHVVGNYVAVPVDVLVKYYKNAGRMALRRFGVDGRVWSRGYDRRFCFTEGELVGRIRYVAGHEKN